MAKIAMALAAHPDDIDFMMGGTLILLGKAGYELHYMNIANGSCGSAVLTPEEIAAVRLEEAKNAAASVGATFHPPLVNDLEIFYEQPLIRKLCAIVREINPEIVLLQSPQDYMEDHQNASRLGVTAAFMRNVKNYATDPPSEAIDSEMCVYHSMPHGLTDQLRNPITPHFFIDVASAIDDKRNMLSCHLSQKEWLDKTQGIDNYINMMVEQASAMGKLSGKTQYAEAWRMHSHMGFGPQDFDPLRTALSDYVILSDRRDK